MNFRKGTTFVLMGLRLKLNNIRSKSNGTRSPLKNLQNWIRIKKCSKAIDNRTKLSGFKTEKISTRVGLDNLKSSLNICTTVANHTLQMGLTSAESRLNNVISKVKTVTPEIENIQAGLQSTMQTSRAKLQKSLEFGFEKTQSGLDNVRTISIRDLKKLDQNWTTFKTASTQGLKKLKQDWTPFETVSIQGVKKLDQTWTTFETASSQGL